MNWLMQNLDELAGLDIVLAREARPDRDRFPGGATPVHQGWSLAGFGARFMARLAGRGRAGEAASPLHRTR